VGESKQIRRDKKRKTDVQYKVTKRKQKMENSGVK
jgi:hypothetical protein